MITLTLRHARGDNPELHLNELHRGWRLLRRCVCRALKIKKFPYGLVIEPHQDGNPHMHILVRLPYISKAFLKTKWEMITESFEVKINRVKSRAGAARYVTKYLTKEFCAIGTRRIVCFSRDWRTEKWERPPARCTWSDTRQLTGVCFAAMLSLLQLHGWVILSSERGEMIALDPHGGRDPPLWDTATPVAKAKRSEDHR